jgi:maltokinase
MIAALPCRRGGSGWHVAAAGDGVAAGLLTPGEHVDADGQTEAGSFRLVRLGGSWPATGDERDLGTDQTNSSVVVAERHIVKWRTSRAGGGDRGSRLRRHLALTGFAATPPLEGTLGWIDASGTEHILADVDAFLSEAEDGWEHLMPALAALVEGGVAERSAAAGLGSTLGKLAADLHVALATPSELIPGPRREASRHELHAVRSAGLAVLAETLAIEADDRCEVVARESRLRTAIEGAPADRTPLQPIHGDLHVGQLVAWHDGFAVIDFDGPPAPTEPAGAEGCTARDVAQLALSLWNLAAAVGARIDGRRTHALRRWAVEAEAGLLASYRATIERRGMPDLLDERLLEPFIAEHLCRELIYAERTLPRWRYAPMQALRWRYPLEP